MVLEVLWLNVLGMFELSFEVLVVDVNLCGVMVWCDIL